MSAVAQLCTLSSLLACMSVDLMCVPCAYKSQRGFWTPHPPSHPPELELQTVMNCHVGAGVEPWSSGRACTLNLSPGRRILNESLMSS